jgi:hypothetical protein
MAINTILYIDDSFENGMTAMNSDPRIDFVTSASLIEKPLREYDCIITDMRMQHTESGFEVVEGALREGRLPYVATGGTYEHGGTFNRVKLFNSDLVKIFNKVTKSDDRFWKEALAFIEQDECQSTIKALEKVRATLGIVPEGTIKALLSSYRTNHDLR